MTPLEILKCLMVRVTATNELANPLGTGCKGFPVFGQCLASNHETVEDMPTSSDSITFLTKMLKAKGTARTMIQSMIVVH